MSPTTGEMVPDGGTGVALVDGYVEGFADDDSDGATPRISETADALLRARRLEARKRAR